MRVCMIDPLRHLSLVPCPPVVVHLPDNIPFPIPQPWTEPGGKDRATHELQGTLYATRQDKFPDSTQSFSRTIEHEEKLVGDCLNRPFYGNHLER